MMMLSQKLETPVKIGPRVIHNLWKPWTNAFSGMTGRSLSGPFTKATSFICNFYDNRNY